MANNTSLAVPISRNYEEAVKVLKERLGVGKSFDVGMRELVIGGRRVAIFFVNGLADNGMLAILLKDTARLSLEIEGRLSPDEVFDLLFSHYLTHVQVEPVRTYDEFVDRVLTGLFGFVVEGVGEGLLLDGRMYPGRMPQEPDTERVVRGSRDGFTENIIVNTALLRRRLRDEKLRVEIRRVGERSKSDVAIAYLEDVANPGLVDFVRRRIDGVQVDGIPMTDKSLQEYIIGQSWNPYPLVRYTERPDVAVQHLLEGHVLILFDTSPSVMITPTTFFHHVQHAEEYRQTPVVGMYLRWVRFFGIFTSVFLLPLWFLYATHPWLVPPGLEMIGVKKPTDVPLFAQILIAELFIDLMRMAAIHTPTPLATALGILATIILGDAATKAGLFVPEIVLYIAVAAIGLFATPSYEMSLANRLMRLFLLFAVALFGAPGLIVGTTLILLSLVFTHSLNTPYFWPLIPFNASGFFHVLFRMPVPLERRRAVITQPMDPTRK
ncbi:spore germination protein [Brockia lithotrophica]|uniref:Stage V sporulation protein AF n=1 Tax=Brockia lithotrophica TaxID=933949 RepID=A0A660L743_9BACL|nr:spore germination protein [Brockia lithotrophica]RKQ88659.1 stage V sporulation protein AF [Brockia lithotrophica]